jgi:hydroxymethylpyrimidine pyrophosphatase-like HAD family hydrolase
MQTFPTQLPRIIATDMDGTLLGSDGRVSERNLAALRLAHDRGVEIAIATGRRHCYAMGPLRELQLCEDNALISSNGTVIRTLGAELMHRSHMRHETVRWIAELCDDFRSSIVLTFDTVLPNGEDTRGALVCERAHDLNDNIGRWMEANGAYIEYVDRLEDALSGEPPIQMMMCGTRERMHAAIDRLLTSPKAVRGDEPETTATEVVLHRTEYPERDLLILDILPAGCSKASALEHLVAARGCTAADVMAIGDNWNDLPMLEYAGTSILMANAPAPLREIAAQRGWQLAPSHDEDGVAWAIEQALGEPIFGASEKAPMVV